MTSVQCKIIDLSGLNERLLENRRIEGRSLAPKTKTGNKNSNEYIKWKAPHPTDPQITNLDHIVKHPHSNTLTNHPSI